MITFRIILIYVEENSILELIYMYVLIKKNALRIRISRVVKLITHFYLQRNIQK